MKVLGVTSAFLTTRLDRPKEYYIHPLEIFLERISGKDRPLHTVVFTENSNLSNLKHLENSTVLPEYPENLLLQFWNEPLWKEIYFPLERLPGLNHLFEINGESLIAVWLGKFAMMRRCFELGADSVFWFDAGHWTSHQHFGDYSKFSANQLIGIVNNNLEKRLFTSASEHGIISTLAWPALKELHIPMEAYYELARKMGITNPSSLPLFQWVFLLIHRDQFDSFWNDCLEWWKQLINFGYGGTEESALTLYGWQKKIKGLSYNEWIEVLSGKEIDELN